MSTSTSTLLRSYLTTDPAVMPDFTAIAKALLAAAWRVGAGKPVTAAQLAKACGVETSLVVSILKSPFLRGRGMPLHGDGLWVTSDPTRPVGPPPRRY